MGILDTSYYGWKNVVEVGPDASHPFRQSAYYGVAVDSSGNIYIAGSEHTGSIGVSQNWIVRRSQNYGETWETVDFLDRNNFSNTAYDVAVDSNDNIYVVGKEYVAAANSNWVVRKSTDGSSGSFSYIDSVDRDSDYDAAYGVAIDSSDNIYVVGYETVSGENTNWIVRKSTDGSSGSFSYIDSLNRDDRADVAYGIAIDSSDNVYVVGYETISTAGCNLIVRKSTDGSSGSFSYIDSVDRGVGPASGDEGRGIAIDLSDNIYVVGKEDIGANVSTWVVRKSTDGSSGSFSYIDTYAGSLGGTDVGLGVATDSNNSVYVIGYIETATEENNWIIRRSPDGSSGSFVNVDQVGLSGVGEDIPEDIAIDSNDNIYVVGQKQSRVGIVRKGKLSANSASLGPRMLASSVGYVFSEIVGIGVDERFKLMNISEFPHSSGLFQMPSLVLGTTTGGKIGKTEDSIIQINYKGSVVHVAWPKQDDQAVPVKGFGDLAAGQRAGKLTSQYEPGNFFDVTEHDHMSLYCYALKNTSGTLDDIELKVERRPIKDAPFATEQAVEYTTSSSFAVGILRDLIFKKEVDYGDLSIKEVGYPLDLPLLNVKELRISAKQRVGQTAEGNKNFVVWARLVKSEDET